MNPYLILVIAIVASHLCRIATFRGHAAFRLFDKPLAALALFGVILLVVDLAEIIERKQWWSGGDAHAVVNVFLFIGLALLVIFVLLPSPYSNKKID